jgi:hypothetical protein
MEMHMFETGKYYKIVTWQQSGDGGRTEVSSPLLVVEVSLPLVKFRSVPSDGVGESRDSIVNTTSLAFVKAELVANHPLAQAEDGKPSVRPERW